MSTLSNCTGFTQSANDVIASRVKGKLCIVSFDEISVKSHLFYQWNTDELIGLVTGPKLIAWQHLQSFLWPVV
jgi:hypothetical protein